MVTPGQRLATLAAALLMLLMAPLVTPHVFFRVTNTGGEGEPHPYPPTPSASPPYPLSLSLTPVGRL